jgi:hypothetical protein
MATATRRYLGASGILGLTLLFGFVLGIGASANAPPPDAGTNRDKTP